MALLNEVLQVWQRVEGGTFAPIGSYWNPRTMAISQLTADGTLPKDGIFVRVDASGTQTLANIATTINNALGTSYTAGSFHTHVSGDVAFEPGRAVTDA
jgi:hypothetical protein